MKGYRTPSNFLSCLFCLLSVCKDPHTADDEESHEAHAKTHTRMNDDDEEALRHIRTLF